MKIPEYRFIKTAGRILNAGQARTLVLSGNIHDLFCLQRANGAEYVPLVNFLAAQWSVPGKIIVLYELTGPIRFVGEGDRERVRDAWLKWRTGLDANALAVEAMLSSDRALAELETMRESFDENIKSAVGKPTAALELLRQMCLCSRASIGDRRILDEDLIIVVEAADMVIPEGDISRLSDADRHRISVCQDWFSDPGFMNGGDSVVLIAESRSMINQRVARLPQIIEVEVPSPDEALREGFISWFESRQPEGKKLRLWGTRHELAKFTAGLSIHALMQLLKGACHAGGTLSLNDVIAKVEEYIQRQLGEDIVEFKKPAHTFNDVIGFTSLKDFLREELVHRFRSTGPDALTGAIVCGPIGSGKTFIFEALATELNMVVLVLKNIRSMWFGQTDVIFERLRRVLNALAKVLIFVDEADTQLGGVGPEVHATERRLIGKIHAMMSDSRLKGRVVWLLMTARVHLLSPDVRRPGRVGDLIIPVLDPEGKDRDEFLKWVVEPVLKGKATEDQMQDLSRATHGYSAAGFASLRSELIAGAAGKGGKLTFKEIMQIIEDHLPPPLSETRRYQTLQAMLNCTRKSLLPDPKVSDEERRAWEAEIRELEAKGVR